MGIPPGFLVHGSAKVFVAEIDAADKADGAIADQQLAVVTEVNLEPASANVAITKGGYLAPAAVSCFR